MELISVRVTDRSHNKIFCEVIMAIMGPQDLPAVLKVDSTPLKAYAIAQLGHPSVLVELCEAQMEILLRSVGDFIAQYFISEYKFAFFQTTPLRSEYPIPEDAHWIQEVAWDPSTTRIDDIFGAESFLFNIGNVSGIQNILTDYHLLQHYRKFSQRVLGTEGGWEYSASTNTIRLYPTPRGSFPVVVQYSPSITEFNSPAAREILYRVYLARLKEALGYVRRKWTSGLPGPDGSTINWDGDSLVSEGKEEYEKAVQDALLLSDPLSLYLF